MPLLHIVLEHGSILIVMAALIIAGFGVPIPEDIMLVAAGVLVARGQTSYVEALIVCAIGVFIGDTVIFLLARRLGHHLLEIRPFKWIFTEERKQRTQALFQKHGNVIVFMGRHMAGLRAPIFIMAGINGVKLRTFWMYDGLGLMVSAPLVIGLGYYFALNLDRIKEILRHVEVIAVLVALALGGVYFMIQRKKKRKEEQAKLGDPITGGRVTE